MKNSKLPWSYTKSTYTLYEGETFGGYSKQFDPPRNYTVHSIVRLGKTERILETIIESTCLTDSDLSNKTEENFRLIVKAVNSKPEEQWKLVNYSAYSG